LNFALVVLLAAAGWRLWQKRGEALARENAMLHRPLKPAPAPAPAPAPVEPPKPVVAADYFTVAEKLLFARDRNPTVVLEATPPKPLPPLPVAHGVLDIGSGPTVILSKGPKDAQRGYRVGDWFGDFLIERITADELVLNWEGKRIRRSLAELRPPEEAQPAPAKTAAATPKPPAPAGQSKVLAADAAKPGPAEAEMGGGIRACRPGDTSPPGTIVGGYKKFVTETPFGKVCRWEPVK